jgi:hypothetical protein
MKRSIAKLWAAALRSGDYKQGVGKLRTADDRFCCLGVLCNLHAQAHPKIAAQQESPQIYLGHECCLPPEVAEWVEALSFQTTAGDLRIGSSSAIHMNDCGKVPFDKFADLIDTHWKTI